MPDRLRLAGVMMVVIVAVGGCGNLELNSGSDPAPTTAPVSHPNVRITGVDGTVLAGELLNGSVTIECGQGPLTLLTDHINSITFNTDADVIDSDSAKVAGKIEEDRFLLKTEHGVWTLFKHRLQRIDFADKPSRPALAPTPATRTPPAALRSGVVTPPPTTTTYPRRF